ncbi:Angiopoietin-1 [Takifugu flavidus]|uniref:Angiopoietin-1 n=1 Tax=Takifugu flavidus TaxID=433684 RepID=A0A5C6NFE2_9TELE|nr:Angiopoietin-1 [Takifugu flavidus]
MLWSNFGHGWLSLAALLVIASCEKGEQRRGTESSSTGGSSSGGGSSSNYSNRRLHRIQHGQCTYTFILPEGDGGRGASCREAKASGAQHNANSLQRDAPPTAPDFSSQKIQQLEHIMENYTQWLQKFRKATELPTQLNKVMKNEAGRIASERKINREAERLAGESNWSYFRGDT